MKKGWIFLLISGLIGCSLSLFGARKSNQVNASTTVNGSQIWTVEETTPKALYLEMAENSAPFESDWSLRYEPNSVDSLVIIKADGQVKKFTDSNLSGRNGLVKYSSTRYYLDQWIFSDDTTGKPAVGDTIKFDGQFINVSSDTILTIAHSELYIRASNEVLTFNEETKQIIKTDFVNLFEDLFDSDMYEPDDAYDITLIEITLINSINEAASMKTIHDAYNLATTQASTFTKTDDGFATYKDNKKEIITNYVSLADYFDDEKTTIESIVNTCCSDIDSATTTTQIKELLDQAKADIDAVETRVQRMVEAVKNNSAGYENYLAPYDNVTLNDLSLGESQTFHGRKNERDGDVSTNKEEKNQFDIFAASPENKTGNVVFNFKYQADAVPTGESNVIIVLRGIKYYGYKFGFGTANRGFTFKRTTGAGDDTFNAIQNVFLSSTTQYNVSISAIDLIEGNKTWIRVMINDVQKLNLVIDSLPFCINPRVSLSNNDNINSDVDGTATISNYYPSNSSVDSYYTGRFEVDNGHENADKTLYLSLDNNELEYDGSNGVFSYASKPENIKLVRGGTEYVLGKSDVPILAKYSANSYQLYLSKLFNNEITALRNGDRVIISGNFAYFDTDLSKKVSFEVGVSKFVFDIETKSWDPIVSVADAKEDALRRLDGYTKESNLAKYDDENKVQITNIVVEAKTQITSATSVDQISSLLNEAIKELNSILTSFEKYRQDVLTSLISYKSSEYGNYRAEELESILSIKETAKADINKSETKANIDEIYAQAIKDIDKVLTDAQMSENELNEERYQAFNEIKNRYAALMNESMSEAELEALNNATLAAVEKVKNAGNIGEIKSIVKEFLEAHPLPETKNNNKVVLIVCLAAGSVLLLGGGVTAFVLINRKRKLNRRSNDE